jgi:hypothetical protein
MADTLSTRLPGAQMLITRILCMKCYALYTEIPMVLMKERLPNTLDAS